MIVSPVAATAIAPGAGASSAGAQPIASSAAPEKLEGAPAVAPKQPHPGRLTIEFDEASQRFVQTLLEGGSEEILRRYPNEGQLAFSRGVSAYVRALQLAEFRPGA